MADRISSDRALDLLKGVVDPGFENDIVSLGFVKDVKLRGDEVLVRLEWPTYPIAQHAILKDEMAEKLTAGGARSVSFQEQHVVLGKRASDKQQLLKGVRNVIAVASGKGGVGKSTLSANLALALSESGASVGLLDCDVYGPSIGLMFGVKEKPKMAGENLILPIETRGLKLMSMAFISEDDAPVIWRGPMVHGLIQQFLTQVSWGALDYLVIDLPPGTGDAQLTLTQSAPLSGAVIITTPQEMSLIDARKGLRMFQQVSVPVLGIVENMSYFSCPHCGERSEIFSHGGGRATSKELNIPFLGEVPIDPEVVAGGDEGEPIVGRNPDSPAGKAYLAVAENVAVALAREAFEGAADNSGDFSIDWQTG